MATKEKTWNVANRIHSLKDSDNPEVNHIIAGADEIYDDAKGAKQSTINAQTGSRLSSVESDINEPASGVKDRLTTLEGQVAFEGDIQVENNPDGIVSGSGKVATANAVSGAIDAATDVQTSDAYATDLDVADESGNVLMRLANGHVKTKNFDSANINTSVVTEDDENADLTLSDENNNVLAMFSGGHIKTKNFDSSSIFPVASISMFARIGVLGASWDAGYFYTKPGNVYQDFNYSWLANACRRNGVEALNFAHESFTTRRWLGLDTSYPTDAQYGIDRLLEQTGGEYVNKCNLYIINFLGNDSKLGLSYLGSLNDINTSNPESNPDTFYGNYGKIVAAIKTVNPDCRIICAGLYVEGVHNGVRLAFKEAVDNIAGFYGFGRLNWEYDNFYKSLANSSELIGNHPTISQLSGMAVSFENCFSKCVSEHRAYFDSYYEDAFN